MFQAGTFVPLADIGNQSNKLGQLYDSPDLGTYVNRLFLFALSIGAILAVVRLMWAGYLYMGSGDMWSSKGKAREVFGDVVIGLLLLLAIYLILYQINPDILKLNILDSLKSAPAATTP